MRHFRMTLLALLPLIAACEDDVPWSSSVSQYADACGETGDEESEEQSDPGDDCEEEDAPYDMAYPGYDG